MKKFLARIKQIFSLKELGILGMNSRNLDYIIRHNNRKFYTYADDKVLTKKMAQEVGIPVPELYAVIEYQEEISKFSEMIGGRRDFVIKPAQGSGGGGIIVIRGKTSSSYIRSSGRTISLGDLKYHISNILGGLYALGGIRDKAIIESRVINIPLFDKLAYQGVPDIRIIVYKGVPVMSMLRLPTHASEGRANLHSGGIGVGLCLRSGKTIHAILKNQSITKHTDTDANLSNIKIPHWLDILRMSVKASEFSKLGYLGVDIVIDKHRGPLLLEINARPGISIQIANRASLKHRLETIDKDIEKLTTVEEKIAYARKKFGVLNVKN